MTKLTKAVMTNEAGDNLFVQYTKQVSMTTLAWRNADMADEPQMLGSYIKFDPEAWSLISND